MNTRTITTAVVFLFLILSACSDGGVSQKEPVQLGTIEGSISHDGRTRSYLMYVPDSYTGQEQVPLLLNFHGYGSNAEEQMQYGDFRAIADTAGLIVLHPQGTLLEQTTHWNVGGWTLASTVDDVGFVNALLDSVSEEYLIDSGRIYSTGMSNGGYMSFLLACQLSSRIAAIASVTGSMTPQTLEACTPEHYTPILQIHGTDDDVVPYGGQNWTESIDGVTEYWRAYNECEPLPSITQLPDTNSTDGSTVERAEFSECREQVKVVHYEVLGGGHTWPGTAFGNSNTNQDFSASDAIWRFLSGFELRTPV